MKKVAAYALFASLDVPADAERRRAEVDALVDAWLHGKGTIHGDAEVQAFAFHDGRQGTFAHARFEADDRYVFDRTLVEPSGDAQVQTRISVCVNGRALSVYIEIQAAGGPYQLGPMRVDIKPPMIVRTLVGAFDDWFVGEVPVSSRAYSFTGADGGAGLDEVIWHPGRNLPLLSVSSIDGEHLTSDFPAKLAEDLAGVAIVATLDGEAGRALTALRGKEWSCFNGAVRLYWPAPDASSPYRHPLWMRSSLLGHVNGPEDASRRFRTQMRRQLLGLSAFAVAEPSDMIDTRSMHRERVQSAEREALRDAADWEGMAAGYARENHELKAKVQALSAELAEVKANLQYALQWRRAEAAEVAPEPEVPPATVEEAVGIARERFAADLVFGNDVGVGVAGLAATAGPPEKVLVYLEQLAAMALHRREKRLGSAPLKWLQDRGVECSGESQTTRNSAAERKRRTWHDGVGQRCFQDHLKPKEAAHPDHCVRIYFDYDDERGRAIVGWVGRHP